MTIKKINIAAISMLFMCSSINAQVTGIAFRDYNGNGTRDNSTSYSEPGIEGIIVKAFSATDVQLGTTKTTIADGTYSFSSVEIPSGTAVRIEFTMPSTITRLFDKSIDFSSFSGSGANGTSVQFAVAGTSVVADYGINAPADYLNTTNPIVYTPVYRVGNPLVNAASPTISSFDSSVFVSFNYNASGTALPNVISVGKRIGSTWGVAHSKQAQAIFTSAVVKRHVGLGPANGTQVNTPGAIYIIKPGVDQGNYFISLDALGVAGLRTHDHTAGAAFNVRPNAGATPTTGRGLTADIYTKSDDRITYDQVGKVGLGGLEVSDDGRYLYTINLYTRELIKIDLQNAANPVVPTSSNITNYALPAVSCAASGVLRPWALKFHRGKIYVGAICTNEGGAIPADNVATTTINETATNLVAYVFEFNPATNTFNSTPLLQQALNYVRRSPNAGATTNPPCTNYKGWYPWTASIFQICNATTNVYPQPLFTDIEFDVDGSMILDFTDRQGHQGGVSQRRPVSGSATSLFDTFVNGDILRAYKKSDDTFEMEFNAKEGPSSSKPATTGANNGEGFGGGEFYRGDNGTGIPFEFHPDNAQGGLTLLPGAGNVLTTFIDPINAGTNGIVRLNNTTGAYDGGYEIYNVNTTNPGTLSKCNGLGDLEMLKVEAPIEIGNRFWIDHNGDGVQNPGELGLGGVTLELFSDPNGDGNPADGSSLGTVVTDANGHWYFSSATNTSVTGRTYNIPFVINSNYIVRVQGVTVLAGDQLSIDLITGDTYDTYTTSANVTGNGEVDYSDNDADKVTIGGTTYYQLSFTTGAKGQNNHNTDFGVRTLFDPQALRLISFAAHEKSGLATINWQVEDDVELLGYDVQRSIDGIHFEKITDRTSNKNPGLNNYSALDYVSNIDKEKIYYRLVMQHNNGKQLYSQIVFISRAGINNLTISPNPAYDIITVQLNTDIQGIGIAELIAADGSLRMRKSIKLERGSNSFTIPEISNNSSGIYMFRIKIGEAILTRKIVIR
jgi:hypothetical protein